MLFCDIVRSTDHRAQLGEVEADRTFRALERQFRDVIDATGGRVLKGGGDGVMALFSSGSEAVNAAVELHRNVHEQRDDLELRVGVAAGDVSLEHDDCFGMPVVVAARLEGACEPGQILVSAVVRLLAGDRAEVEYTPVGELDLKGVPDPVPAFEVTWTPTETTSEARPFPATLPPRAEHPCVGRAGELHSLLDLWSTATVDDDHAVVVLGGEAGAGKTRLATEFARRCHRDGGVVVAGVCDRDVSLPYQPWVMVIDQLVPQLPVECVDDLRVQLAALTLLVPHLETVPGGLPRLERIDPEAERLRMFDAVASVIAATSATAPVLIVLDDLHWAGSQTLDLLRYLVGTKRLGRCVVVTTLRDTVDEISSPLAQLLADFRRSTRVTQMSVGAMSSEAVWELLDERTGREERWRRASAIVERTGGNAFLVTELLRAGSDADHVPDSVVDVVTGRLLHLSHDAGALADVIAVAGRVELDVLRELAADRELDMANGLGELVRSGLVLEVGRPLTSYQFAHALIREAVGRRLAAFEAADLHAALARAVEEAHAADRRSVLPELARHYAAAAAVAGWEKAAYYGRRAAAHARRTAAYEEAIELLDAALLVTPGSTEERAQLLIDAVDLHERSGRSSAAIELAEEADDIAFEIDDVGLQATASIELERAAHLANRGHERSLARLRRVLAAGDRLDAATRIRACGSLGRARWLAGHDSGPELTVEALRQARDLGDPATLGHVLEMACVVERDPNAALRHARELEEITAASGNVFQSMWAMTRQTDALITVGRLAEAEAVLERLQHFAERYRFASYLFLSAVFTHTLALAAGEFELAESASEAADATEQAEGLDASGTFGLQMFMIRRAQGRLEEMRPVLQLVAQSGTTNGVWRPGLVLAYAELGMVDEAAASLEVLMTDGWEDLPRDSLWHLALMFVADSCVLLDEPRFARSLLAEFDRFDAPTIRAGYTTNGGPADRCRAALAELAGLTTRADRCIAAAADVARSSRSPVWEARVEWTWAWILARRGCPEEARGHMRIASELADRLGMHGLRTDLPGTADAVVAPTDRRPDELSSRELEVLAELALGLTNRQIADRLFISANTAANHVRAILRKTGCANRTEAAAYAHRSGLTSTSGSRPGPLDPTAPDRQ